MKRQLDYIAAIHVRTLVMPCRPIGRYDSKGEPEDPLAPLTATAIPGGRSAVVVPLEDMRRQRSGKYCPRNMLTMWSISRSVPGAE
jgi:hypothetical protein